MAHLIIHHILITQKLNPANFSDTKFQTNNTLSDIIKSQKKLILIIKNNHTFFQQGILTASVCLCMFKFHLTYNS